MIREGSSLGALRLTLVLIGFGLTACGAQPGLAPAVANSSVHRRAPTTSAPEAPSPSIGRSPSSREAAVVQRLERVTSRLRGLDFRDPVDTRIHSQSEIRSFLTAQLEEESLPESLALLAALGLVESAEQARVQLTETLGEQVVGYYDPRTASLVVRDDAAVSLGSMSISSSLTDPGRLTLIHELVHALQDQRLNLGVSLEADFEGDGALAYRALVEGDATLVTLAAGSSADQGVLELIAAQADQIQARLGGAMSALPGQQLSSAPPILRALLMGPYLHGMVFVARLYHEGGWEAVNAAYAQPPRTMAEVLHLERYRQRNALVRIPASSPPSLQAAGFTRAHEETLGELGFAVYLAGQAADSALAWEASEGWLADQTELWVHPDEEALALSWSAWESGGEAQEAERAARSVAASLSPEGQATALVARYGPCLLIARGAPSRLHGPLQEGLSALAQRLQHDFPQLRH